MKNEYRELVQHILANGEYQQCRNGLQIIIPHYSFTLDLSSGLDLSMFMRKIYLAGIYGEFHTLTDFDTPLTNVKQFEANGCNYWKDWADDEGNLNLDYYNMLKPQFDNLIRAIKADPTSRRLVIELWNYEHVESGELSLPCCWHNLTFSVIGKTLYLKWGQRSVDTMIGLPSDIILAQLFMRLVAKLCDLEVGTCMFSLSNVHIYSEHIIGAEELLERDKSDYGLPYKFELKA